MEENTRVQDFLSIFQGKSKSETCDLIKSFRLEEELVQDIINIIEADHASQICDTICEILFNVHSSGQEEGIIFCLQFLPALIWAYYSLLSKHVKWSSSKVETLLLYIYNQVVQTNNEIPFSDSYSYNIPTLSKPSIYHEPMLGVSSMLTEHTLSHHDKADKPILIKGPTKFLDKIPAGYRSLVIKSALKQYNEFLSFYVVPSLHSFCRMVMRLSTCGFIFQSEGNDFIPIELFKVLQSYPKVTLNADVMKEMVTSLHFIAFNGCVDITIAAMKSLHRKASYSICTAAVLATDAVQDIINLSTNGDNSNFEHSPPLNPYKCKYRVVHPDSIQKRKLLKQYHSMPRIPHMQDVLPLRPSDSSSPRTPEVFRTPGMSTSSADVIDGSSFMEKAFGSVFIELGKKVALIDDNLILNNTTETDIGDAINLSMDSRDFNGHNEENSVNASFIELTMTPKETPKIVIDLSDFNDGRNSDEVPLINSRLGSYNSNEGEDSTHTSSSPLQSDGDQDVQMNGDVGHVYDTQL